MPVDETKLLSLLGMCRRAGKLSCGHDASIGSISRREAELCLLSSDSSERLQKELKREVDFHKKEIPVILTGFSMEDIKTATGLRSAVLTINDNGFAQSALKHIGENFGRLAYDK